MIRLNRAATAAAMCRWFLLILAMFALERNVSAAPTVYTAFVVTDIRVGGTLMHNAAVRITFVGDTDNILQVPVPSTECNGNGYFIYLTKGDARIEIESQGRTHTARLNDGQVFVAEDTCNGGIGFGAFTGPNGLEPAYPLAFTLGTAEYYAVGDGAPLTGNVSVSGSAWSCVGYPPGSVGALPGTASGNCLAPDPYPLKSSLGDIVVYQPYFEYGAVGFTDIASNHSGSTNRGSFSIRPGTQPAAAPLGASASEGGTRVVYTLQTVADGSLGGHHFSQALVTLQMVSNLHSVTSRPSSADALKPVYENVGNTTITVDDGGKIITAEFEPGEVYVRYDTGTGVAGFGSRISPTYPVSLNCSDSAYPSDSNYTADCQQGEAWNYISSGNDVFAFRSGILDQLSYPVAPSAGSQALPQSLSRNTLLTGPAHECAGVYTIVPNIPFVYYLPGDLGVCSGPAPRGLRTSRGELFLQDLVGGSNDLGNAVIVQQEAGSDPGWDLANSGFLHVEVIRSED